MSRNVRIAERLVRLAKMLVAGDEQLGDVYYHVLKDNKSVSFIFTISSNKIDELDGWMDSMLGMKKMISPIASKYGFEHVKDSMDLVDVGDAAMTYPLVYGGDESSDLEGFVNEMKQKYNCVEVKG